MIKFEVGKSYYLHNRKSSVAITKRTACYVSGVDENGDTFRRKILTYTDTISTGDGKTCEAIYPSRTSGYQRKRRSTAG